MEKQPETKEKFYKNPFFWLAIVLVVVCLEVFWYWKQAHPKHLPQVNGELKFAGMPSPAIFVPQLDLVAYDKKLMEIANNPVRVSSTTIASSTALTLSVGIDPLSGSPSPLPSPGGGGGDTGWPVKTVYPNYGALLPFNRIVAYYGNLYSRGMGVLGEYPEDVMLDKLSSEVLKWQTADPATPVIPALHYIAVVAQAGPGRDGKYRARMPDKEIEKVLAMSEKIHGIVFLDIQIGKSAVQTEVPLLEKYLKLPNVHLGIDPEFATHDERPGVVIGTFDATDINFAAEFLAKVVRDNNLTPKILVIHRFTKPMVTNYKKITPLPEVQIVMEMDGFGSQGAKLNTYQQYIYKEPVQFTGFKLFYKNDNVGGGLFTPQQLLKLSPIPVYIQYQ